MSKINLILNEIKYSLASKSSKFFESLEKFPKFRVIIRKVYIENNLLFPSLSCDKYKSEQKFLTKLSILSC